MKEQNPTVCDLLALLSDSVRVASAMSDAADGPEIHVHRSGEVEALTSQLEAVAILDDTEQDASSVRAEGKWWWGGGGSDGGGCPDSGDAENLPHSQEISSTLALLQCEKEVP